MEAMGADHGEKIQPRSRKLKLDNGASEPVLTPVTSAGEAAIFILHDDLAKFRILSTAVLRGDDPEVVHDMRVAARRMRAALRVFEGFLPRGVDEMDGDLKWLFRALGRVRDADIEVEKLNTWLGENYRRNGADELRCRLQDRRSQVKKRLVSALASPRFGRLVARIGLALGNGPPSNHSIAGVPVLAVAPDLILERHRKVRKAAKRITETCRSEDVHILRKRAKKLRYALEFFHELYGNEGIAMIQRLKSLQDLLGRRQDDVLTSARLRALIHENILSKDATSLAMDLVSDLASEAASLERDVPTALQPVLGGSWKPLNKKMKKRRRSLWRA